MSIRKNDKKLTLFVQQLIETLSTGKSLQFSGFGRFSSCSRKATSQRPACTIAMFRASQDLYDYAMGGPKPDISGPHVEIILKIIDGLQQEDGIDIPHLGRMAIVPQAGKKPKLIFHACDEFNANLAT